MNLIIRLDFFLSFFLIASFTSPIYNINLKLVFTNVHLRSYRSRFEENGCILPEPPENGHYKLDDCDRCTKRPGDTVPIKSVLTYSCKSNYLLSGNTISVCVDNEWSEPPSCYSKFILMIFIREKKCQVKFI